MTPPTVRRSPLQALRPSRGRLVVAVLLGPLACAAGWFVGASAGRTVVGAVAVVSLALLLRVQEPAEARWPDPPARRTRPGWHAVVGTQRALEAARTDRDDRRAVGERLDALAAAGPDPRLDAARAAVGLPAARTRRTR